MRNNYSEDRARCMPVTWPQLCCRVSFVVEMHGPTGIQLERIPTAFEQFFHEPLYLHPQSLQKIVQTQHDLTYVTSTYHPQAANTTVHSKFVQGGSKANPRQEGFPGHSVDLFPTQARAEIDVRGHPLQDLTSSNDTENPGIPQRQRRWVASLIARRGKTGILMASIRSTFEAAFDEPLCLGGLKLKEALSAVKGVEFFHPEVGKPHMSVRVTP